MKGFQSFRRWMEEDEIKSRAGFSFQSGEKRRGRALERLGGGGVDGRGVSCGRTQVVRCGALTSSSPGCDPEELRGCGEGTSSSSDDIVPLRNSCFAQFGECISSGRRSRASLRLRA